MRGYKALNPNLCCRGFRYEVGKTYELSPEEVIYCYDGFHFCKQASQCFDFYDKETARICEVEAEGVIIENNGKCSCSKITILREITGAECGKLIYGSN